MIPINQKALLQDIQAGLSIRDLGCGVILGYTICSIQEPALDILTAEDPILRAQTHYYLTQLKLYSWWQKSKLKELIGSFSSTKN